MDDTIITLQTMMEHHAQEISHLSRELYTQQKELAVLKRQFATLDAQWRLLAGTADGAADTQDEPPPPHY